MVMFFFTGAEEIPPMGYDRLPELNFNSSSHSPTSSTCGLQLTLPTRYSGYGPFKRALVAALCMDDLTCPDSSCFNLVVLSSFY